MKKKYAKHRLGLVMGIDRILDMTRTVVNITGDTVCTTIVAKQDGSLDKGVFAKYKVQDQVAV